MIVPCDNDAHYPIPALQLVGASRLRVSKWYEAPDCDECDGEGTIESPDEEVMQ